MATNEASANLSNAMHLLHIAWLHTPADSPRTPAKYPSQEGNCPAFGFLYTEVSVYAEYNVDFGGLSGLAPERALPEGWRAPAAAHQQVKAADTQLRQGASLTQLHSFLLEFFDCLELDYDVCEVNLSVITLVVGPCRHDCLHVRKANITAAPHC